MHITESFIQQLTPPPPAPNGKGSQAFYRDSELIGFGVRVASGGTKSYILERRIRGKVKRITLGRCDKLELSRARARATKLIGEIERENAPRIINGKIIPENISLLSAFQEYLAAHPALKPLTIADYRRSMQGPLRDWRGRPVRELTEDMILLKHETYRQHGQARYNNAMRLLRAVLNHVKLHCVTAQHKAVLKTNPVDVLTRHKRWYESETTLTQSRLDSQQLSQWWQAGLQLRKASTRDYLQFLLLTGLPHSMASQLTWDDVNFNDKTIRIKTTDPANPSQVFPLSNYLLNRLHDRMAEQAHARGYLFPGLTKDKPLTDPQTAINRLRKLSGIHFTLSDLHRTFIHLAAQSAVHPSALKRVIDLYRKKPVALSGQDIDQLREIQERVVLNLFFIIGAGK